VEITRNREESFLDLYLEYTQKQESPEMFHLWTAITILASALGRKCYIDKGYYYLFPNLFTILVAGSARCRKSTAINLGIELLLEVPDVRVVSGKITPEKFIHEIADPSPNGPAPSTLVHASELSVFLTKQSYGEPLIHVLTELFDCPKSWTYKTRNKGEAHLRDVFLCILAATTPDGIAKGIPPSAIHEGFASRVMFCYQADTQKRNPFPHLSPQELDAKIRLKQMLAQRSSLAGAFTLTPEARQWYKDWYDVYMAEPPPDKMLAGMHARKHDHLLRLAMIFAASYGLTIVEPGDLEAANLTLTSTEALAPKAFSELGGDDLTHHISRARSIMLKLKRLQRSELLRKLAPANASQLKIILDTLIQTGEVKYESETSTLLVWSGDD
jgi:hypothetical protein